MAWSVRSIPPRYHTLTLSPPHLITANHSALYILVTIYCLSSLVTRSFSSSLTTFFVSSSLLPYILLLLPLSLSLLSSYPPISSTFFLGSSLFPLLPLLSLSPPPPPLSSPPHTPHRKVMPKLSVLKWDNWTCWRQDQRRTAPSRLSR